jgi:hypothetical protein
MFLFATLVDNVADAMKANILSLVNVFQAGLTDTAPAVQLAALKGVHSLVKHTKSDKEVVCCFRVSHKR